MSKPKTSQSRWSHCKIGITGANGSFGKALVKKFRQKGAFVIGITHSPISINSESQDSPDKWVSWQCGEEESLKEIFKDLDILIINHGINPQGKQNHEYINKTLEINALSSWRLLNEFEKTLNNQECSKEKEIWVNTSEAEIQPAFSPAYEISKRLIGELVSIKWSNINKKNSRLLRIRKLILGPFKSELNPYGLISANLVADIAIRLAEQNLNLIIVSPNPITYILMPITEFKRYIYCKILQNGKES